jgi:hypothetical protein
VPQRRAALRGSLRRRRRRRSLACADQRAGRDTVPCGISCRVGCHAKLDAMLGGMPCGLACCATLSLRRVGRRLPKVYCSTLRHSVARCNTGNALQR